MIYKFKMPIKMTGIIQMAKHIKIYKINPFTLKN